MSHFVDRCLFGLLRRAADTYALALLRPFLGHFLPWSDSAMRPSALLYIANDIILNSRCSIVEFGAGVSTSVIAHALDHNDRGQLISFEEDADWLQFVRRVLEQQEVCARVKLVHAPLNSLKGPMVADSWYQLDAVLSNLPRNPIDLLLVDGPKASSPGMGTSRHPALPLLVDALSDSASVVLDDINRRGELAILRSWAELLKKTATIDYLCGDIGVIRLAKRFNSLP